MSFKNVLCFGSLNPDLVYFIEKLPSPGGDIQSKKYFIRPGGTAINCAEKYCNVENQYCSKRKQYWQ